MHLEIKALLFCYAFELANGHQFLSTTQLDLQKHHQVPFQAVAHLRNDSFLFDSISVDILSLQSIAANQLNLALDF